MDKNRSKQTGNKGSDWSWFWENLDHYLARNQLKQTKQRKTIVEYFLTLHSHLDAEELHEAVRKDGHNIGLATIYRTLNLLTEAGLVEQKNFQDGKSLYEVILPNEHHDHLVCLDCGKVVEFENDEIERLQEVVAEQHGFELISHTLDMFGRCSACQKKKKN